MSIPIDVFAGNPTQLIGKQLGLSRWYMIDQMRNDIFGRVTEDWDIMHVDPDWCRENSPYGQPLVFGFLTLSMISAMVNDVVARPEDEISTLNFGCNRLRLLEPILVDQKIRGRISLKNLERRRPGGQYLLTYDIEVECENANRPGLVAEWLTVVNLRREDSEFDHQCQLSG